MIEHEVLQHQNEVSNGRKIWYIAELVGVVMELDIQSRVLSVLWPIPGFSGIASYRCLYYNNEYLYVIPYSTNKLYIYNIENKSYEIVMVKGSLRLMGGIQRGDYIYFYGWNSTILKMDIYSEKIEYIEIGRSNLDANISLPFGFWFWNDAFLINSIIQIPIAGTNIIFCLDEKDYCFSICLGEKQKEWRNRVIYINNKGIYSLLSEEDNNKLVVKYGIYGLDGDLCCEKKVNIDEKYSLDSFTCSKFHDNEWILLPYNMEGAYRINIDKCFAKRIYRYVRDNQNLNVGFLLCSVSISDDWVISINQYDGTMIKVALGNKYFNVYDINYDRPSRIKMIESYCSCSRIINENTDLLKLSDYLDYLKGKES